MLTNANGSVWIGTDDAAGQVAELENLNGQRLFETVTLRLTSAQSSGRI